MKRINFVAGRKILSAKPQVVTWINRDENQLAL
jgi:hypothetical protein